jgi:molecular chaperone GrpE
VEHHRSDNDIRRAPERSGALDDTVRHAEQGAEAAEEMGLDPELADDLGPELDLRGDVLETELEDARVEVAVLKDRVLRMQAEFENYRKRMQREQEDTRARAGERMATELLPALDNLERAIDHTTAGGDLKQLLSGVEMVHQQVLDVFAAEGVAVIDPFGQPFDPHKHEAVSQRADSKVAEGTVVEVLQRGYEIAGRVIRPAMVILSTGGPAAGE